MSFIDPRASLVSASRLIQAMTGAARSEVFRRPEIAVLWRELVAVFAMCGGVSWRSAACVFGSSNRFHVVGIDATAIAAKVIDYQCVRDSAASRFVCDAVGQSGLPSFRPFTYQPIADAVSASLPNPAPSGAVNDVFGFRMGLAYLAGRIVAAQESLRLVFDPSDSSHRLWGKFGALSTSATAETEAVRPFVHLSILLNESA